MHLKSFKSKATGLHHCTYPPGTALGLHRHGPRKPQSLPRHPEGAVGLLQTGASSQGYVLGRWQATGGSEGHLLLAVGRPSASRDLACHTEVKVLLTSCYKTKHHPHLQHHSCHSIFYQKCKFQSQNGQHTPCACIKDFCRAPSAAPLPLTNTNCKCPGQAPASK